MGDRPRLASKSWKNPTKKVYSYRNPGFQILDKRCIKIKFILILKWEKSGISKKELTLYGKKIGHFENNARDQF